MDDYWRSTAAIRRQYRDRHLRTARAIVNQEPLQKGPAANRQARAFRAAIRDAVALQPDWPRPRAALALDLSFATSRRTPPGLWALPKNYLDLLGATSAPRGDPGPVLYRDDRQVRLLFVSCSHDWQPNGNATGRICIEARTRSSALVDMQLAGELIDDGDELWGEDPMGAAQSDPSLDLDSADELQYLPPNLLPWFQFQDLTHHQEWLLASNDRRLRAVFFGAAHWLLTGTDPEARRIQRLKSLVGSSALKDLEHRHAEINENYRQMLNSGLRVELPPLPMHPGEGASFKHHLRVACRDFMKRYPVLKPLVVPLRLTVLVTPPRSKNDRRPWANAKDLDNILITILKIVEAEFEPHAEPWLLAPAIEGADVPPHWRDGRRARLRTIDSSNTWAYQVLELHRGPTNPDQGSLTLIPGLGWNRKSLWQEAEQIVDRHLEDLI